MTVTKIIIVEDDAIAALSLKETLEGLGYAVAGLAESGKEALALVREKPADLVLMDIFLNGEKEGIETGRTIMSEYSLPVVFLTAYSDKQTISKAREVFPYGYMTKPFIEMELFAVIETAVYKHLADKSQQALNQTKDKFYSVVAHDLRSPLAALEVATRMLSKKADKLSKEEVAEFTADIHDTVKNLILFTENLLDWTKVQSERLSVYPEELQLGKLTEEVLKLLIKNAKEKNIIIIGDYSLEDPVKADKKMIRSVLLNLVQNSLKFTEEGGKVKISIRKKGSFAEVTVEDQGVGMDQSQQNALFDIRQSFSTLGTQEEKGTGLGLMLCKEFVELHGGSIAVRSLKGQGTEVKFSLPLSMEEI